MILCSCNVISDHDIEVALIEIFQQPDAPLPTPGVVFRHLQKKMNCCSCAPLAVETIYKKMSDLIAHGRICPKRGAEMRGKLLRLVPRNKSQEKLSVIPMEENDRLVG